MVAAASWNLPLLHVLYELLGWLAFAVWSLSFWPQVILNYQRKSVVGLNFDFVVFNLTKHTSYLIFNAGLFFSPIAQQQYHDKYGPNELVPVAASDVAFSIHAVALTAFTTFQLTIYENGGQRVSFICRLISAAAWTTALAFLLSTAPAGQWLQLLEFFNLLQVVMTSIKYIPQAWFNFRRRSTLGWSVGNVLLDLSGGLASFAMMALQSIDQGSMANFSGNVGKLCLSLETIAFDVLFGIQHYCLYPEVSLPKQDALPITNPELEQLLREPKNDLGGQA